MKTPEEHAAYIRAKYNTIGSWASIKRCLFEVIAARDAEHEAEKESLRAEYNWQTRHRAAADAENAKLRARVEEALMLLREARTYLTSGTYMANRIDAFAATSAHSPVPHPTGIADAIACFDCGGQRAEARPAPDNGMLAPVWAKLDKLEKSDVWLAAQVKVTDDYNTEMFAKFQLLERRFVDLDALAARVTELEARLKKVEKQDHAYEYDPAVGGCKRCGGPTNAIHTAYPTSIPNTTAPLAPVTEPVSWDEWKHSIAIRRAVAKPETAAGHAWAASIDGKHCRHFDGFIFCELPESAHAKDVGR